MQHFIVGPVGITDHISNYPRARSHPIITPPVTIPDALDSLSHPNLQFLALLDSSVPDVESDRSSSQTQLHHLKRLHLGSSIRSVFGLLNRLEFPDKMDNLNLSLDDCSPLDLPQTLGPYLGNQIRRRSPDRLGLSPTLALTTSLSRLEVPVKVTQPGRIGL